MPLSNDVVRQHADALNTQFNAQQALTILALINAAVDQAGAGTSAAVAALGLPAAAPTADDTYVLDITSGVATWVAES